MVFLDSVDEAQLETPRARENAVRIFGSRIHVALERSHIFITSREDAWRALSDQTLIEQHLPFGEPALEEREYDSNRSSDPMLKVFHLVGLLANEIEIFASHYGVGDITEFVDALKRSRLLSLAECPFDLKALIKVWIADRTLGSRFEVLQRMISLQLEPLDAVTAAKRIISAKARSGARALAIAVTMTGNAVICLPNGVHGSDRIDPRVLMPDWTDAGD